MMALLGLISSVFLLVMYALMLLSRSACAFMMRSMLALHPYSPVTSTHGESTMRSDTKTFSTLSPRMSLMMRQRGSNEEASSSCFFLSSSVSSNLRPSLVQQTSFLPERTRTQVEVSVAGYQWQDMLQFVLSGKQPHLLHSPSYSLSCWTAYSSMGSTMNNTSYPLRLSFSRNGEFSTAFRLSPVM